MKIKTLVNSSILFIGLGLTAYSWLKGYRVRFNIEDVAVDAVEEQQPQQKFERWQLKPGSVYDGDTIRATKDGEEIRVRFCGIDAPVITTRILSYLI